MSIKRTISYGANGEEIYDYIDESQMDATNRNPQVAFSNPKYFEEDERKGDVYEQLGKRDGASVYDALGPAPPVPEDDYLNLVPAPLEQNGVAGIDNDAYDECM